MSNSSFTSQLIRLRGSLPKHFCKTKWFLGSSSCNFLKGAKKRLHFLRQWPRLDWSGPIRFRDCKSAVQTTTTTSLLLALTNVYRVVVNLGAAETAAATAIKQDSQNNTCTLRMHSLTPRQRALSILAKVHFANSGYSQKHSNGRTTPDSVAKYAHCVKEYVST